MSTWPWAPAPMTPRAIVPEGGVFPSAATAHAGTIQARQPAASIDLRNFRRVRGVVTRVAFCLPIVSFLSFPSSVFRESLTSSVKAGSLTILPPASADWCAEPHAGPIGRLPRVGQRIAVLHERHDELVGHVRVRTAVPAALGEAQVPVAVHVVNAPRGELADGLGKPLGEVGRLDRLGDLRLWQFGPMHDQRLVLDQRPLDARLRPVERRNSRGTAGRC